MISTAPEHKSAHEKLKNWKIEMSDFSRENFKFFSDLLKSPKPALQNMESFLDMTGFLQRSSTEKANIVISRE